MRAKLVRDDVRLEAHFIVSKLKTHLASQLYALFAFLRQFHFQFLLHAQHLSFMYMLSCDPTYRNVKFGSHFNFFSFLELGFKIQ